MSRADNKGFEGFRMLFFKNIYQIHKLRKKKENRNNRPCPRSGIAKKRNLQ